MSRLPAIVYLVMSITGLGVAIWTLPDRTRISPPESMVMMVNGRAVAIRLDYERADSVSLRPALVLAAATTSPPNDAPCTSNVVIDYGADPSGTYDSTAAFYNALNATPLPLAQ